MRKIIEANDKQDVKSVKDANRQKAGLIGLSALALVSKSSKDRDRRKLMNDIMYYLRKLLNLAKKVQSLSEGVEDDEELYNKFDQLKSEIDELEGFIKEKS